MHIMVAGGRLFDPAHGWQGEVRDLYLAGDRVVSHLPAVDTVLDARGCGVVPGGIDLRGQVATYGLNFLRLWGELPSPAELGRAYAALGYTHVHEPFLTPTTAGYVHRELARLPVVDTSASLVLNLRDLDLWLQDPERLPELAETVQFLLEQTRSLNVRVVEPWVRHRQEFYEHRTLSISGTLDILARLAAALAMPIALEASPEVLREELPEPQFFHLAALGAALTGEELVDRALGHLERGASGDLGLIWPREALGGTGQPVMADLGLHRPLNLAPPRDRERAQHALRLASGYKGGNLAFSGAGAFQAPVSRYPGLFAWLGDRQARREFEGGEVGHRLYSFQDWVYATRTLPARLLGLADRGHLGPGARADLALFDLPPGAAPAAWPQSAGGCRTLLKAGEVVWAEGSLVRPDIAKTTYFRRTGAEATTMVADLCQSRSFRPENLWVSDELEGTTWIGV